MVLNGVLPDKEEVGWGSATIVAIQPPTGTPKKKEEKASLAATKRNYEKLKEKETYRRHQGDGWPLLEA